MVLSTLHTNSSMGAIPRLIDLGAEPFLLSSIINLVIAQRLARKICPDCKKETRATEEVAREIEAALSELPAEAKGKFKAPYTVYQGQGCQKCKGKGTVGRLGLFEIFKMTSQLAQILAKEGLAEGDLFGEAKRQKMITLRQDGVLKALLGLVAMENVLRETSEE